jgi:hypothetical protein
MVCHKTLANSVKRERRVKVRMGVSTLVADAEGIEEPKNVSIVLPVHNRKGTKCVWILTCERSASRQPRQSVLKAR